MTVTSTPLARSLLVLALVSGGVLARRGDGATGLAPVAAPDAASRPQDDHTASGSPDFCLLCHEPLRELVEASVPHMPVSDGECTMCHSPHAARYPKLLNVRVRALCSRCHQDQVVEFQQGSVHTPVRQGECLGCHQVHGSEHEALLTAVGNDLCLGCHEEKQAAMQLPSVHDPFVNGECSDCHLPHNAPYADQLMAPAPNLCTVCHEVTDEALVEAHLGIPVEGARCLGCHDAHASAQPGMLKAYTHEPFAEKSCDLCHLVDSDTPRVVFATGSRLCNVCHDGYPRPGDPFVHQPVADGKCGSCHMPHASAYARLLPESGSELCMECHADLQVRREDSRSAHPLNDEVTCQSCHQVHSSKEEHLLLQGAIRTCLGCHGDQRHGHPLGSDRLDPRTGEPITCITCHDPHGTEFPLMLRGDQSRGLCLECHTGDEDGHRKGAGR